MSGEIDRLRECLAAALAHADECERRAAAERAARARAVEEAQSEANLAADRLRAEVREIADRIHRRERELWRPPPGAPVTLGCGAVALELDAWATDLWIAIGDYPRPRGGVRTPPPRDVAGSEPCHGGRVRTPPRAE